MDIRMLAKRLLSRCEERPRGEGITSWSPYAGDPVEVVFAMMPRAPTNSRPDIHPPATKGGDAAQRRQPDGRTVLLPAHRRRRREEHRRHPRAPSRGRGQGRDQFGGAERSRVRSRAAPRRSERSASCWPSTPSGSGRGSGMSLFTAGASTRGAMPSSGRGVPERHGRHRQEPLAARRAGRGVGGDRGEDLERIHLDAAHVRAACRPRSRDPARPRTPLAPPACPPGSVAGRRFVRAGSRAQDQEAALDPPAA